MTSPPAFATPLFSPFTLGECVLRNRFVMPAMTRRFSNGGIPGRDVSAYYERRAQGGTGLIITEGGYIDSEGPQLQPSVPVFFGDTALNAWRDIVRAVHDRGAGIVPQIWRAPVSMDPGTGTLPSERRLDLLNAYSRAAEQIRLAGFDGVEIQSGGKHSADLFVSAGHEGSFAVEVLRILRKAVGDDFPIILRVSEWRRSDGHTPIARSDEELATLLRPCAEAGVSVFHLDTATFDSLPYSGSFTDNRPLASRVRELTGRPVIAVGSIAVNDPALTLTNLQRLALSVERDDINLLALGRAHLADPEWVEKFRSGRLGEALPYDESLRGTLR